jgi:TonB family protein
MQFQSIQNAIDLLGPAPPPAPPPELSSRKALSGRVEPKIEIAWGSFHQGFWSSVAALFGPSPAKNAPTAFRDSSIEGRVPRRAVFAAALWHVAFLLLPVSLLMGTPHLNPVLQNTQLTWSGPIEDFPLLELPREKPKATRQPKLPEPAPQPAAVAFHPRQRIFTDPVRPTHPRQTLINPKAPFEPPKLLPNLPNMVQLQQVTGPAKPRLQISEDMLKSHPKETHTATSSVAPPLDVPNMEQHVAEMNLPSAQRGPARPKLELNAGAAPRIAQKARDGDTGPAPDVGTTQLTAANGAPSALIALSANPAPPAPVQPPQGNLAAKVSISPDAAQPAAKGSAGDTGAAAGKSPVGISISGGNPSPSASGNAGKIAAPPRKLITRPDPKSETEDVAERTGPPDFAALPPGAKPEAVFAYKRVYTMNVNMPNLNSSTGSWILNFSELHNDSENTRHARQSAELSGPVPVQKVDPKYPPTLISERVTGEVVLYAVIRRDGSVDNIQLVRGLDQQLDANAIRALRQWRFRPGAKEGAPVELEAIVHIPFRLPEP